MPATLKFWFIFFAGIVLPALSCAQLKIYQFEQIDSLQKLQKRPVAVFLHTDWCQYCQAMKNTTFKDEEVISLLNKDFYFLGLNAEEERTIRFNNYTFKYKPTGSKTGVHALAEELGTIHGQLSYPMLCFLTPKNEILYQHNGFLTVTEMKTILGKL